MAFSQGRTCKTSFYPFSFFPLWLPCRPRGLVIYKQQRSPDINKNNLIFHIRLLKEEEASVLLGGSALLWVMSQNKQIKRLSSLLSSYHSILVAFFHVGEQWLKWLYWSSLSGSQMKPARAVETNWIVLRLGFLWRPLLFGLQHVRVIIVSVDWYFCPWSKNSHWKAELEVQLMDEARAPSCGRLVE